SEATRDDRAVSGSADLDIDIGTTRDGDGLGPDLHFLPFVVDHVPVAVDPFDEQVHRVWSLVGDPPGDAFVVADHHARSTRKGEPRHAERAVLADLLAPQGRLIPDRRQLYSQMR